MKLIQHAVFEDAEGKWVLLDELNTLVVAGPAPFRTGILREFPMRRSVKVLNGRGEVLLIRSEASRELLTALQDRFGRITHVELDWAELVLQHHNTGTWQKEVFETPLSM